MGLIFQWITLLVTVYFAWVTCATLALHNNVLIDDMTRVFKLAIGDSDPSSVPFAAMFFSVVMAHLVTPYSAYFFMGLKHDISMEDPRTGRRSLPADSFLARAFNAHQNAMESYPGFCAAVVVAHAKRVDIRIRVGLSMVYVLARIAHWVMYLANFGRARFFAYHLGVACVCALFLYALVPTFPYSFMQLSLAGAGYRSILTDLTTRALNWAQQNRPAGW